MNIKNFFCIVLTIFACACAHAQHENCSHGDAPNADAPVSGGGNFVHLNALAMRSMGVETAEAKTRNFENVLTAIGKIENIPANISALSSRIAGRAVEVYVQPDSFVKKGQAICKIESLLSGNPPPSVTLTAPSSGIVEALNIVKGAPVLPENELARIADTKTLYAVANVFEPNISKLKIGDSARIKLEALGGQSVGGKLAKFGSMVNQANNTLPVYFLIDNPDGKIKSGMRGVFAIITGTGKSVVTIDSNAISEEGGLKYVYVKEPHSEFVFERRQVAAGLANDERTEILEGLKSGEQVAVKGVYQLKFFPRETSAHNEAQPNADAKSGAIGNAKHDTHEDAHENEGTHAHEDAAEESASHAKEHAQTPAQAESKKQLCPEGHDHSAHEKGAESLSSQEGHDKRDALQDLHDVSADSKEDTPAAHSADSNGVQTREGQIFTREYLQNFVYVALALSVLLNLVFAYAYARLRKDKASSERL